MARMADRMIEHGVGGKHDETFENSLRSCERIIVDNVSEYLYAGTDQEIWDWGRDFPNLAPPFPTFWMEAVGPKVMRSTIYPSGVKIVPLEDRFATTGVFAQAYRRPKGASTVDFLAGVVRGFPGLAETLHLNMLSQAEKDGLTTLLYSEPEWAMCLSLFLEHRNKHYSRYLLSRLFFLDGAGALVDPAADAEDKYHSIWTVGIAPDVASAGQTAVEDAAVILFPFGLAISLMHCKNVELVEHRVPSKLQKAYRKRRKREMFRYHVLDIEPMKKVLRMEGDSERVGLKRALHICRGHFKDYRERGLFGQHHGIYWWESQLRGDGKLGIVSKDYNVEPTAEEVKA